MKFHEDRCKGEAVMPLKPFYLTACLQTDGQTDGQGYSSIPPPLTSLRGGIITYTIKTLDTTAVKLFSPRAKPHKKMVLLTNVIHIQCITYTCFFITQST